MNKPSIFVFLPAFGQTNLTHTTASLVALAGQMAMDGVRMSFATYSYVFLDRLRNLALTYFYDQLTPFTHMLTVDADMEFDPIVVQKMLAYDVELTGVVYPTRSNSMHTSQRGFVWSPLPDQKQDEYGFMPVRGLGGGIMLIRRDCITKLLETQPELSDERPQDEVIHGDLMNQMGLRRVIRAFDFLTVTEDGKSKEFGEDLSFCERVRRAGMTVYGDVGDPVAHVGLHSFYGCWGTPLARPGSVLAEAAE